MPTTNPAPAAEVSSGHQVASPQTLLGSALRSIRLLAGFAFAALTCLPCVAAQPDPRWVVFKGGEGPGKGKHVVFVTGDEEYRSEESMPQLAKILAVHHGFKCTVLFAINPQDGTIDPVVTDNIPGLEALKTADLMVLFIRFRELPDDQMKCILDYTNSGGRSSPCAPRPILSAIPSIRIAPTPSTASTTAAIIRAATAVRFSARPGSTTTESTRKRARAD